MSNEPVDQGPIASTTPPHANYPTTLQVDTEKGTSPNAPPLLQKELVVPIKSMWNHQRINLKIRTKILDLVLFLPAFLVLVGLCYHQYTSRSQDVFYGNDAMISQFMTDEFPTLNSTRPLRNGEVDRYHVLNSFEKLNYIEDWKVWMDTKIIEFLWDSENPTAKNTRNVFNYASGMQAIKVGAMQIRVIRTREKECQGNTFSNMADRLGYQKCVESFNVFSPDDSIPDTFGPMVYQTCDPTAFIRTEGREQFYWCDGNVIDIPFSYSYDEAIAVSNSLHNATFSILRDYHVRLITVEMFMYFPATDTLSHYQLLTELPISGSVITSSHLNTVPMFRNTAYAVVMIIGFVGVALLTAFREITTRYTIMKLSVRSRVGFFFTWIPVPIYSAVFIARMGYASFFELKPDDDLFPKDQLSLVSIMFVERHVLGVCLLALFGRLMNLMSIFPMLRIVTRTIEAAFVDLVALLCVFIVIFVTYALAGTILYSDSSPSWRSYSESFGQTVLWMLGDADYADMRMVNIPVAIFFFWSYTVLVIFVLLNFFVGVLEYAYSNTIEAEGLDEDSHTAGLVRRELRRIVLLACTIPRRDYVPLVECVKSIYDQQRESIIADLFTKEADKERAMDAVRNCAEVQSYPPIGGFSTNAISLADIEKEYLRRKAIIDASPYRFGDERTRAAQYTQDALRATEEAKAADKSIKELAANAKVDLTVGSFEEIEAAANASRTAASKATAEAKIAQAYLDAECTQDAKRAFEIAQGKAAEAQQRSIILNGHLAATAAILDAARATADAKVATEEAEAHRPTSLFGRCKEFFNRGGSKLKHLYWKAFLEYPPLDKKFAQKCFMDSVSDFKREQEIQARNNTVVNSNLYDHCVEKWNKGLLFQASSDAELRDFNLQVAEKTFETLLSVLDPTLQYCKSLDEEEGIQGGSSPFSGSVTGLGSSQYRSGEQAPHSTTTADASLSSSSRVRSILRHQEPREDTVTAIIRKMMDDPQAILGDSTQKKRVALSREPTA